MISVQNLLITVFHRYPHIPKHHVRSLLSHHTTHTPEFLMAYPEKEVPEKVANLFLENVKKLASGVPLSRLLGKREFWGMAFELSEETLDPRADSETLIEAVLKVRQDHTAPLKILDLGTGTGCLIISLLREYPNAFGVAVDQSFDALNTAEKNARTHGVGDRLRCHQGSWFHGIQDTFDIIISNPPYISDIDYETLEKNVKEFDPKKALVAGKEGLDCYKEIIPVAPSFLKQGGILVLEVGYDQKEKISLLLTREGFSFIQAYKDLQGRERCLLASSETN